MLAPTPVASVFTIHNLAYQGVFPHEDAPLLGLPSRFMTPQGLEYHGPICFMKAGLKFADRVSTVSPGYAREIATPEYGAGLDGVIRGRGRDVVGILNGIDTAVWDPARDPALAAPYDRDALPGKAIVKAALQRECGLDEDAGAPLLAVVSRLTGQKGLDLVLAALPALLSRAVSPSTRPLRPARRSTPSTPRSRRRSMLPTFRTLKRPTHVRSFATFWPWTRARSSSRPSTSSQRPAT